MRHATLFTLSLCAVLASVGCDLPTEIAIELECADLVFGCSNNGGSSWDTGAGRAKRLRVTTITTGTPLDSIVWYQLEITNDVGGASWPIAQNSSGDYVWGTMPVGEAEHLVTLSDIPDQCEVQGEHPRTVTIVPKTLEEFQADPIETTFEVVCS